MESLYSDLGRQGATLQTAKSSRMAGRPARGKDFEDLGSDFANVSTRRKNGGRSGYSSSQGSGMARTMVKKPTFSKRVGGESMLVTTDDSDDEADLFSQPSSPHSQPPKGSKSKKSLTRKDSRELKASDGVLLDGDFHAYHQDYMPRTVPKFKKNKSIVDSTSTSSSLNVSETANAPTSKESARPLRTSARLLESLPPQAHDMKTRTPPALGMTRTYSKRERSDREPTHRPRTPSPPLRTKTRSATAAATPQEPENYEEETPRPTRRPVPRPVKKSQLAKRQRAAFPDRALSPLGQHSDTEPGTSSKGGTKNTAEECPISRLSPVRDANVKGKGKTSKLSPPSRLPLLQKGICNSNASYIPLPSPLSSPVKPQKGLKSKRVVTTSCSEDSDCHTEDKNEIRPRLQHNMDLKPFPMKTQMLASIGRSPKRASRESYSSEGSSVGRERKRVKGTDEMVAELEERMYSDDNTLDVDDMFMDPDIDPALLCPWCDELLPPVPSPHLLALIATARAHSYTDSRPTNPLGLQAAPALFVAVCQRHQFESHQIPLARSKGWPTQIEWDMLGERVRALKKKLRDIIEDVDEEFLLGYDKSVVEDNTEEGDVEDEEMLALRPRKASAFWREIVKDVRKKGSRQAAGIRGQMTTFSKTQPGYYGELGYVIINQTIYDLFPPSTFAPESILPLTPPEFIQRVLIPEAAAHLVMEDMQQSRREAICTLRESAQYGVAMFPDDQIEGTSVGEQIVKKRAEARRKQIEQEDIEEDALWTSVENIPDLGDVLAKERSRSTSRAPSVPRRIQPPRSSQQIAPQSYAKNDSDSDSTASTSHASGVEFEEKRRGKRNIKKNTRRPHKKDRATRADDPKDIDLAPPSSSAPRPRPRHRQKAQDFVIADEAVDHMQTSDDKSEVGHEYYGSLNRLSSQMNEVKFGARDGKVKIRGVKEKHHMDVNPPQPKKVEKGSAMRGSSAARETPSNENNSRSRKPRGGVSDDMSSDTSIRRRSKSRKLSKFEDISWLNGDDDDWRP